MPTDHVEVSPKCTKIKKIHLHFKCSEKFLNTIAKMNNISCADFEIDYHELHKIGLIIFSLLNNIIYVLMIASIFWNERFEFDNTRILTNILVILICYNEIFCVLLTFYYTVLPYCHMLLENLFVF